MFIDAIQKGDSVKCWVRDEKGELVTLKEPAPFYVYLNDPNGKEKDLYGNNVTQKTFKTYMDYKKFIGDSSWRSCHEADISPVHKFLSDNFYGVPHAPVRLGLFDIEVDYDLKDGKGYPTPENSFGEINSVSLYIPDTDSYHLIKLNSDVEPPLEEDETATIKFYNCVTEKQLLDTFLYTIEDIDVLSAWFGDGFDIPYILQRLKVHYGAKGMNMLCRDGENVRERETTDDYGNTKVQYTLVGRVHLDMMDLYKKFTFGERNSYSLDAICEHEKVGKKRPYVGDLGDQYRENPELFFDYSLHDTRLLKKLEEKMQLLDLALALSRQATIKLNEVFGSIKYLECAIRNYCRFDRAERVVMPTRNPDNRREEFPGAFVLRTRAGSYKWSSSIDLASLYPSVIRSINISPETHLFQLLKRDEDFVLVNHESENMVDIQDVRKGDIMSVPAWEVKEMLTANDLTMSANGSIFAPEQGLVPELVNLWYTERKELKDKGKEYELAGDKENASFYDMRQHLRKIALNSIYGAMSNPWCRFYSLDIASSITLTGQYIERYQIWKADQVVDKAAVGGVQ